MGLLNVVESSYCTSCYYEQRHRRRLRWRNHACSDRVKYSYIRLAIGLLSLGASLASQTQKAIYAEVACETTAGLTHSTIPQHVSTSMRTASEPQCVCHRSDFCRHKRGSNRRKRTQSFSGCTAQLVTYRNLDSHLIEYMYIFARFPKTLQRHLRMSPAPAKYTQEKASLASQTHTSARDLERVW